jgi:hypothetical protein
VTVFLDYDAEGETGMKQCLGYLAQLSRERSADHILTAMVT